MFFACSLQFSFIEKAHESKARNTLHKMFQQIKNINGVKYNLDSFEKSVADNSIIHGSAFTKVNANPFKVYIKITNGKDAGTELLYATNEHNNKVVVNVGKWVPNIRLNPMGSLITKNQHHTIFSAGFSTIYKILLQSEIIADKQNKFDSIFKIEGEVIFNGAKCWKMVLTDNNPKLLKYKVLQGETIFSVAQKLMVSEYSIMQLNQLKDLTDEVENKILTVPSSYATMTVLFIDEKTFLPIYQSLGNNNGEFERYEFSNLQINPTFSNDEFSEKFSEYGF